GRAASSGTLPKFRGFPGHEVRGAGTVESDRSDYTEHPVARMVDAAARTAPGDVVGLLELLCELVGARTARFFVADYSLRLLQQIDRLGKVGAPQPVKGTLVGRAFISSEPLITGTEPTVVSIPLVEGTSRIGVLELD